DAGIADRPSADLLRLAPEARADRRVGTQPQQAPDQRRHREIRDERPGHLRGRRHQFLPGQEEADPLRLPRSGPGGVRDQGAIEPGRESASPIHDDQPDHAQAARRRRQRRGEKDRMRRAILAALLLAPLAASAAEGPLPDLSWRLVGPFRAGWATVAIGIPEQPDTFYFGGAGGGVWKTTNAGRTWRNVSDAAGIVSVGAIAIAPSNPNIVYVGSGQSEPRYDIAAGD